MLIEHPGHHVRNRITPVDLLAERDDFLLDALNEWPGVEFRIFQEREQKFQRAVAGAPADAIEGGIEEIDAVDNRTFAVG